MTPKTFRFDELEKRQLFTIVIQGVQPASLDQPRINAYARLPGQTTPLTAEIFGFETFNITGFYDTGASGILISNETAEGLGVPEQFFNGSQVVYSDVGVGGSDDFHVSQLLDFGLAPYNSAAYDDLDNPDTYESVYTQIFTNKRTQIGPIGGDPNPLLEGLDVFGTPLMENKVMVMDPSPLNSPLPDTMRTYAYNPGTPFNAGAATEDPGIPNTSRHIRLSYGSFDRFTKTSPVGAAPPTLRDNPFIGSNPVRALDGLPSDGTPPVTIAEGALSTTGSFLLDTGAAASILSTNKALGVGVRYRAGTFGTEDPVLEYLNGTTVPNQYTLSIGGIGGTVKLAGFYLNSMTVQTQEGEPIVYEDAPFLVGDITVLDDKGTVSTADDVALTLDGIFGMNNLVASIFVDESSGTFGDVAAGPFDWLVYDPNQKTLGVELGDLSPNPRVTDQLFDVDDTEQRFYVQFNQDVSASLTDSDISIKNLTSNFTLPTGYVTHQWDAPTLTATFEFPGYPSGYLPDGNYRATIAAANVDDGDLPMAADYNYDFFFLNGDATRDRKVDTKDFNILAKNFGTASGAVFTQGDFNYDQGVDSLDFAKFVSQYGHSLPAPAPVPGIASATGDTPLDRVIALPQSSSAQTTLRPTLFLSPGLFFAGVEKTAASNVPDLTQGGSTLPVTSSIFSANKINTDTLQDLLA